jgi:hypothetical protein
MTNKAGFKIAALVIAVSAALVAVAVQPQQESSVTIWESTLDLSRGGVSTHTCILVQPDGRFHLEKKTQRLPSSTANREIFDYSLDASQFQQLRSILDDEKLRQLPAYVQPALPMSVPWSHGFDVKILRAADVQHVGYWTWRGGTADTSPNSAPQGVKNGWQESEAALKPMADWLHGIESMKLSPSRSESTMCVSDTIAE